MDRRTALGVVGLLVGYLHGKPVAAQQGGAAPIFLPLDGVDQIILQRRGVRVVIPTDDLVAALTAPGFAPNTYPPNAPNPSQFPRR